MRQWKKVDQKNIPILDKYETGYKTEFGEKYE